MLTASLSFEAKTIPADLKRLPHWVCWRAVPNGARIEKIPVCVSTGRNASSTDPQTWTDYTSAVKAAQTHDGLGVGFVFAQTAGIVGVDLDKCRDADTGILEPWAEEIVRALNSYTEVSPSGTGLHLFVRGTLPPGKRKNGQIETYEHARFFTMTGQHLAGTPTTIEDRTADLPVFHARYLADPVPERPTDTLTRTASLGDVEIVEKCRTARNAGKFDALWRGNASGYSSQSDADLALLGILKFYTQEAGQLDRLFRQSGLMREKWDQRRGEQTYGERSIAEALAHVRETYTAPPRPRVSAEPAPTQTGTGTDAPAPTTETQDQTLARLATLSPVDYGQKREGEARRLGVALKFLDQAIRDRQKQGKAERPGQGRALELEDVRPCDSAVDGVELVQALVSTFTRYIHLPPSGALACALWVIRAHAHECFDFNPRLAALSPEKGCGKTTLMDLVARLVPRALCTSNISPASVFRVIETAHPALLMDEMDTFEEAHEELRGILNSGHTRVTSTIVRTVGDDHEPRMFSTWCPMMFAAIGRLPGTLEDRSLVIPMQRCTKTERAALAPLVQSGKRAAVIQQTLRTLSSQIARWVLDHTEALQEGDPLLPDGLTLRALDNWAPLVTIAELVSAETATKARDAALSLSGFPDPHGETAGVQLLDDLRTHAHKTGGEHWGSQALCDILAGMEERPWGDWQHGKPLTPVQLAKLLKPFRISSRNLKQSDGTVLKGYTLHDLTDAFGRYLAVCGQENDLSKRYAATSRSQSGDEPPFQSATEGVGSVSQNARNPAPRAESSAVAFPNPQTPATYATRGVWEGSEDGVQACSHNRERETDEPQPAEPSPVLSGLGEYIDPETL